MKPSGGAHWVLRCAFLGPFRGVLAPMQRGQPEGVWGLHMGFSMPSFVPQPTSSSLSSTLPSILGGGHCGPHHTEPWPLGGTSQGLEGEERDFIREFSPHSSSPHPRSAWLPLELHPPTAPLPWFQLFLWGLATTFSSPAHLPSVQGYEIPTEACHPHYSPL